MKQAAIKQGSIKQAPVMILLCLTALFSACTASPLPPSYRPCLPALPSAWKTLLGEPNWRLEWINGDGGKKMWEGGTRPPELSLIQEWSSPVIAWPYWPEKGLFPGEMKPAGAIFPWDVSGGDIILSWPAGVDAFFWRELAAGDRGVSKGTPRVPWYFDWERFRELMQSADLAEAVRADPWKADWRTIAKKTLESGFNRSRLVPYPVTDIVIPHLGGLWIGASPFSLPLDFPSCGPMSLPAGERVETWVSAAGVLRCGAEAWFFSEQ
jgi:hypothetical protein